MLTIHANLWDSECVPLPRYFLWTFFFSLRHHLFTSPKMRTEFKRFGLSQFGPFVACLEILGSLGLFIGIKMNLFLVLSSAGLALLMLTGVLVRVKSKDMFKDVVPALFFLG